MKERKIVLRQEERLKVKKTQELIIPMGQTIQATIMKIFQARIKIIAKKQENLSILVRRQAKSRSTILIAIRKLLFLGQKMKLIKEAANEKTFANFHFIFCFGCNGSMWG